jgi:hypothetical protein
LLRAGTANDSVERYLGRQILTCTNTWVLEFTASEEIGDTRSTTTVHYVAEGE